MDRNKFSEAIQSHDQSTLDIFLSDAAQNSDSLREFLQHLLVLSASSTKFEWHPECGWLHPTVVLNSVKNICALRSENPSLPFLKYAIDIVREAKPSPRDSEWRQVSEEERTKPLFVMDFRAALKDGDVDSALRVAAKILLMSENKTYVLEIICDSFLSKFDVFGLLTYSFYRASAFCSKEDSHHFVSTMLEFILSSESNAKSNLEDSPLYPVVYASAHRIQSSESVLQNSFQRLGVLETPSISENSETVNGSASGKRNGMDIVEAWVSNDPESLGEAMKREVQSGDKSWPVKLIEARLMKGEEISPFWIVMLDSVQYLLRVGTGWRETDLVVYLQSHAVLEKVRNTLNFDLME